MKPVYNFFRESGSIKIQLDKSFNHINFFMNANLRALRRADNLAAIFEQSV
jgi:hypothetical protein